MSVIDDLLVRNARFAEGFAAGDLAARPALRLAVVTCMDARLVPPAALGLEAGDAHIIRNAGGVVTDDVIRSLSISQHMLGTEAIMLVRHTRCGLQTFTDEEFAEARKRTQGVSPDWVAGTFEDLEDGLRGDVQRIRQTPFIPRTDDVRAFVYEVETGRLRQVH
jgi:carbonic anhydrase